MTFLAGCKGFWDNTASTGGTGTNPASGVFYVLNEKTNQVAAMQFLANSSGPTALTGSPYTLAALPYTMAIAPTGNYLYVSTVAGVYVFTVSSTGTLTIANGGAVITQDSAFAMAVDPTGTWLVEVVSGQGTVNAVPISASSGLFDITRGEKTAALPAITISQLAMSPANSTNPYVFVAMGSGGTAAIPFTTANANPFGTVSSINVANSAGGANAVAVDPSNRLLYVGETAALSGTQTGGLRVFTIAASSVFTEITGSPFSTGGTGPSAILPETDLVYVANKAVSGATAGNITGFSLASSGTTTITYSLTSISTIAAGDSTMSLAMDSTGTYVLAANSAGNPDLSTFVFDATTSGKLDTGPTSATGTDPTQAVWVVAHP
jgi:6-phosphogluconolactonase (cycloisomerase 2 family)